MANFPKKKKKKPSKVKEENNKAQLSYYKIPLVHCTSAVFRYSPGLVDNHYQKSFIKGIRSDDGGDGIQSAFFIHFPDCVYL